MKRIFLSALLGMGVVVAIFCSSLVSKAAPTPEDYPLVCRGGGDLVIGIAPGEGNIGFSFTRGTKPAGEGLAPGECSWMDRGMYPNEPDRVSQHVEEGLESLKVGGTLAPENRWYEELHSADNYWTFMVSNNGRGQLIATSARPNKKKEVSPTARVPSQIGEIRRPDLSRARALDAESPRVIVPSGPVDPNSRTEVMNRLPGGRSINVPPAPRSLSVEEKLELLKSTGLKPLDETPTPYLTLSPQQPYVAARGDLVFWSASIFAAHNYAAFSAAANYLTVHVNFETKGIYLMTFTVNSSSLKTLAVEAPDFVFEANAVGPTVLAKIPAKLSRKSWSPEWQQLNIFVPVDKPGYYSFSLYIEGKEENLYHWSFGSCDVSAWRK